MSDEKRQVVHKWLFEACEGKLPEMGKKWPCCIRLINDLNKYYTESDWKDELQFRHAFVKAEQLWLVGKAWYYASCDKTEALPIFVKAKEYAIIYLSQVVEQFQDVFSAEEIKKVCEAFILVRRTVNPDFEQTNKLEELFKQKIEDERKKIIDNVNTQCLKINQQFDSEKLEQQRKYGELFPGKK